MLFTFKRDSEGRETIHVGDVAIARVNNHPEGFEWLASPPAGVTAERVREAAVKADEDGFWYAEGFGFNGLDEVTVSVPIPETTSTILSITNAEDQS